MSQHDFVLDDAAGAAFLADSNLAIQALASVSSGSSAPSTTYPYQPWADTTSGLLKQRNAANTLWVPRDTLAETLVISRASNTILTGADRGRAFVATAGFTQTLTAAATLGDGWWCAYDAAGFSIVFDPNSTETIDGAVTKTVTGSGFIFCNGSAFYTVAFLSPATQSGQEAASSVVDYVTPGCQQYHPSAAKAWFRVDAAGGVSASYNTSSVTDTGTGQITPNWTVPFSGVNYCALLTLVTSGTALIGMSASLATGSAVFDSFNTSSGLTDPALWMVAAYGDQ
jgi:hypothetical protein